MAEINAKNAGTLSLGDRTFNRLGYGTMQLPGKGVWGPSENPENAVKVLQSAVELGINFIDTADAYGPFFANLLMKKAYAPYQGVYSDLFISTKVGQTRQGPNLWTPDGRPDYLRQQVELNLWSLGVDHIDLLFLHRIDPKVPLAEQLGELKKMQAEGKIKHIGLSQVSVADLEAAEKIVKIDAVQNRYNVIDRTDEAVLDYAEAHQQIFVPWFPLATGKLAEPGSVLSKIAEKYQAQPAQIALAWLLQRSPVILPIPGTANLAHLKQNVSAANIKLAKADFDAISQLK
ncbi:aldo/keto reductase [Lactobacillus sp. CC-MHH1034]|uniref:aldo/keto reductase n=1 Tax=Agrilactobacillus fermenti TaxID=2586909 RepID=UPI001E5A1D84|nr:aldo/keto reductase [Agrilactobacillus fermenti]MCD2256293.1 aldo/keto reductase [Agrilactobacillus fermenti]